MKLIDELTELSRDRAMGIADILEWYGQRARCCRCDHYKQSNGTCTCTERGAKTNEWVEAPELFGCCFFVDVGEQ